MKKPNKTEAEGTDKQRTSSHREQRIAVPLPCPFCGRKPKVGIQQNRWADKGYQVACMARECGVNPQSHAFGLSGKRLTRSEAITAWNSRHNVDVLAPAGEKTN